MKKITLILSFLVCSFAFSQSVATYNFKFTNFWNATDHNGGNALPGNAHWSDLVGANHNSNVTFAQAGGTATTGVENIAELGAWSVFRNNDIQDALDANNAQQFINAGDLFLNAGTEINFTLQISEDYPLLTLLSMIAPSPDWLIVVNSLDLRSGGTWQNSITIDLYPYDAGTEEGSSYTLSNAATSPQGVITNIRGVAPFNMEKVAQLTVNLDSVLSSSEVPALEDISIYPNPSKGNVTISNIQNMDLEKIEVYSVLGSLVKQVKVKQNLSKLNLDLSNTNKGIFLLKITDKKGSIHTQKLVID